MDECVDALTNEWMDGWVNALMGECMVSLVDEWMDG